MRKLAFYGSIVIAAHIGVVCWHLVALAHIQAVLSMAQIALFAGSVSLLPALALVLLWTSLQRLGAIFMFATLAVGFVVGGYEHILASGPGNIFQLPPGEDWATSFRVSAIALLMLEIGGCWIASRLLAKPKRNRSGSPQSAVSLQPRR